jgi:signal transduction histidine kinase
MVMNFRDISIRRKLTWAIMLTSTTVLLLTGLAFMTYELTTFRSRIQANVRTVADIIALNSAAALAFHHTNDAHLVLDSLRAYPNALHAALYTPDGQLFASYKASSAPSVPLIAPARNAVRFEGSHYLIFQPVIYGGKLQGTFYLKYSLASLYEQFRLYGSMVLMILAGSSLAALALSAFLQKRISQPILRLARTAREISGRKDYSVRADKTGNDELGILTDSFNDMLTQIQQRDDALRDKEERLRTLNADLERRVQERTAELTEANRELEAFTYSVAHDLRAPLRHIAAFSQILQEEIGDNMSESASDLSNRIRVAVHQMGRLVDDLLNLARIGRQELRRQPTELPPIVEEVIASFKSEIENRNIEFRVGALPVVKCDPALMHYVFTNLISNAIKYTRPRERAVVEIAQATGNGSGQTIFVRDNGVGFSMQYADKLFGVFQRLHRAEQFEGTGVGLAIVERIIRKHGGKVWAEAEPDKGATFYFSID